VGLLVICMLAACSLAAGGEDIKPTPDELKRYRELCFEMGNENEATRWRAAGELMKAGPKAIGPLSEILKGDWLEGRRMVAYMLGEIKHPAAIGPLANALGDGDFHVRWKAAVSLRNIGAPSTEALIGVLAGGNLEARRCAAWALGEVRAPEAAGPLCRILADPDDELATKARVSLGRLGLAAIEPLTAQLKSSNPRVRYLAAGALGDLADPRALAALELAARDPDPKVRQRAATSLGSIGTPDARPALERLLKDDVAAVRREATIALAHYGLAGRNGTAIVTQAKGIPKVERWALHEIELSAGKLPEGADPFVDAAVSGEFVSPSKAAMRLPGFYAGEGRWKLRVSPSEVGEWSYAISIAVGEKAEALHGLIDCVESKRPAPIAADAKRPGCFAGPVPIEVGTTGLWCLDEAGSPRNTPDGWGRLLDAMAQAGVSKLRLKLIEPCDAAAAKARPELSPWARRADGTFDLNRFELRYWDALDGMLDRAAKATLTVELVVFDEDDLRAPAWPRHPFNRANGGPVGGEEGAPVFYDLTLAANEAAQGLYLGYLAARTASRSHVMIELNSRMNWRQAAVPFGRRWAKQWAELLHGNAPPSLLVSLSPADDVAAYLKSEPINVAGLPEGFAAEGIERPCVQIAPAGDAVAMRRAAWTHAVHGRSASFRPGMATVDELTARVELLAPLAKFVKQLPQESLRPDDAMLLALPKGIAGVAAGSKQHVWVYLAGESRGDGELAIGAAPGAFRARWFSPVDGNFADTTEGRQQDGTVRLRCPPFTHDMALMLELGEAAE
jgi:HEAT repeat protein